MKVLISLFIFTASLNVAEAQPGLINSTELDFLQNYLQASLGETQKVLSTIDDSLWLYRPRSGGWSIAECMEHIMLAEEAVFEQLKKALSDDAVEGRSLRNRDGLVITFAVDRGKKVKTPLPPKTISATRQEYLEALKKSRTEIVAFLSNPGLPLRSHFGRSPFGEVDAYQLALIIGAHGLRHTAQMKEVIGEYSGQPVQY